jgi:hypothetical protein
LAPHSAGIESVAEHFLTANTEVESSFPKASVFQFESAILANAIKSKNERKFGLTQDRHTVQSA